MCLEVSQVFHILSDYIQDNDHCLFSKLKQKKFNKQFHQIWFNLIQRLSTFFSDSINVGQFCRNCQIKQKCNNEFINIIIYFFVCIFTTVFSCREKQLATSVEASGPYGMHDFSPFPIAGHLEWLGELGKSSRVIQSHSILHYGP